MPLEKNQPLSPYVLLKDSVANKKERSILNRNKNTDEQNVLRGSLWIEPHQGLLKEKYNTSSKKIHLCSMEFESVYLSISKEHVSRLIEQEYALLVAIVTCEDRYTVFQDRDWFAEGLHIVVGDVVYVLKLHGLPEKVVGKVRYKGELPDKKGTWFGVELSAEYQGKGTSNGEFQKRRLFSCGEDCAVFKNINGVRLCRNKELFTEAKPLPIKSQFTEHAVERPPIQLGERVVWWSDLGPEKGNVRWIGYLNDGDTELTVGVEFDNPVGTGTGKFKEKQLFKAPHNHASLIPLMGLLRESDEPISSTSATRRNQLTTDVKPAVARGLGAVDQSLTYRSRSPRKSPSENDDLATTMREMSFIRRETGHSREEFMQEQQQLLKNASRMKLDEAKKTSSSITGSCASHK